MPAVVTPQDCQWGRIPEIQSGSGGNKRSFELRLAVDYATEVGIERISHSEDRSGSQFQQLSHLYSRTREDGIHPQFGSGKRIEYALADCLGSVFGWFIDREEDSSPGALAAYGAAPHMLLTSVAI